MGNYRFYLLLLLLFVVVVGGCTGKTENAIELIEPWARKAPMMSGHGSDMGEEGADQEKMEMQGMGGNGAAYMIIKNSGKMADKLLKAESNVSQVVELHISEVDDGVMRMRQVEYIDVPAKGEAELKPGGLHIMLIGLTEDLIEGDTIELKLYFENFGEMVVEAPIRSE